MVERFWEKRKIVVTACFILIAILLAILPPEAELGQKIRLVFFHASIAENSIIFFSAAAIVSAYFLIKKKEDSFYKARSLFTVAFYLWIAQSILGGINMKIIWGGFFWEEPKVRVGLILLAISLIIFLLSELEAGKILLSMLYIFTGTLSVLGFLFASNVFHPQNAIFGSDMILYKIIFPIMALCFFIISLTWSISVLKQLESNHH